VTVERWDLIVVGAGPAGSAAALGALTARPDCRVLLLDRADFPRDKACGDGVAPHVLDVLTSVGLGGLLDDLPPIREFSLVHRAEQVHRRMHRPVRVVPRTVLDERLVAAAVEAGATLRRRRVGSVTATGEGVVVDGDVSAPLLVGADGARSRIRAATGLPAVGRQALAIRGYAPTPGDRRDRQVIVFGERRQPSYAWSFDRGDGLSNVGYGELLRRRGEPPTRARLLERLEQLLPGAAATGEQWRGHHLPLAARRWRHPRGRVLLAGDAAALINPMTGEGIYHAVATGVLAGRTVAQALTAGRPDWAADVYRHRVRELLARHQQHTAIASRLASVPPVVTAGVRAAAGDQFLFDDLVEVGLGPGGLTRRLALAMLRELRPLGRP
jgi:geranylgeranyl reductase family protein